MKDKESSQAEKGLAASGGEVCTHDVGALMPHPCTYRSQYEFCAVCDPSKRPHSLLDTAKVLCEEMGVLQICLLRSSSRFPLTVWCSIGRVAERRKLLINSEGGRSRKGM